MSWERVALSFARWGEVGSLSRSLLGNSPPDVTVTKKKRLETTGNSYVITTGEQRHGHNCVACDSQDQQRVMKRETISPKVGSLVYLRPILFSGSVS